MRNHPTWIEVYDLLPAVVHARWFDAGFWARIARLIEGGRA